MQLPIVWGPRIRPLKTLTWIAYTTYYGICKKNKMDPKCSYNCILLSLSNNVLLLIIPLVVSVKMCIRLFCLSISKNTRATQIKKDIHWQSMVNDEHELQRRRFNTLSVFHSLIRVSLPDIKEFLWDLAIDPPEGQIIKNAADPDGTPHWAAS